MSISVGVWLLLFCSLLLFPWAPQMTLWHSMPRVELFCDTHGSRFEGSKCRSLYCCGLVPHFLSSWVCLPGQNILKPHCSGIFMNILGFRPRDGQSSLSPWLILESPWKRASGCVSGGISRNLQVRWDDLSWMWAAPSLGLGFLIG